MMTPMEASNFEPASEPAYQESLSVYVELETRRAVYRFGALATLNGSGVTRARGVSANLERSWGGSRKKSESENGEGSDTREHLVG